MQRIFSVLVLLALLLPRAALAGDDAGNRLIGSWRLISFQVKVVGDETPPRDILGPRPFGRLILTPGHAMAAYLSRSDRKQPTNEAEAAALLSSMVAYTGKFRLDGDKFITTVDGAWNEIYKAQEQVRYFAVDGGKLTIRTPDGPSGLLPGKLTNATLVWERED